MLELLDYQVAGKAPNPDATANPGNVHLCLAVDDCDAAWKRAVALGARPIVPEGPVDVDARSEHRRAGGLSPHPRRHHARALSAGAEGSGRGDA